MADYDPNDAEVQKLEAIFNRINVGKNGFLNRQELVRAIKEYKLPTSNATALFQKMDLNKDGRISKEEFMIYAVTKKRDMKKIFDEIDTEKSGTIKKNDIHLALAKLGIEADEQLVKEFFELVDRNKDHNLDFEEFSEFLLLIPHIKISYIFDHWIDSRRLFSESDFTTVADNSTNKLGQAQLLFAGGIAGAVSRTLTAPLDRLKTMFQAGPPAGQPPYTGIVDICKRVMFEGQGVRAFFKGNGTNVIKIAPESAIKFWAFETLKTHIAKDPQNISVLERFTAGAVAGLTAQTLIYPMEVTKTRLAIATHGEYSGIVNCLTSIVKTEGPTAAYKGLLPALCGIIPYAGVDLCTFSFLKDSYRAKFPDSEPGVLALLACGAISSTCGTLVAYPLVVVRTRLQAQGMAGRPVLYKGMLDCGKQIFKNEGIRGFYRGIVPNFLKAIPAISSSYVVYEKIKYFMQNRAV